MRRSGHLPMPKLAYQDKKFMESLGARPLRIIAEYLDPLARLRKEKVADTIVMFGSARIPSRERALDHLHEVQHNSRGRRNGVWRGKYQRRPLRPGNVAVLRGSARAFEADHAVGYDARD